MRKIKNILFDLGGVILDLDIERCIHSINELGVPITRDLIGVYGQNGLLGDLEKGLIEEADFYNRFRKEFNITAGNEAIKHAWNSFLVGIPNERLSLLKRLRMNNRLFLLSNTSKIHYDYWQSMFKNKNAKAGAESYFDGVYCSFLTHITKPDSKAFEMIIDSEEIKPEETLFFDDSEKNIKSALEMGFNCVHVKNESDLMQYRFDNLK